MVQHSDGVERSPCIGIQMRLPWVGYFVILTYSSHNDNMILPEAFNLNIKESHGN